MTTFTATVIVEHRKELRRKRDMTDEALRDEYHVGVTDEQLAKRRARDTYMRGVHTQRAATSAVDQVLMAARDASMTEFISDDDPEETVWLPTADFQDARITLEVHDDLTVTALLEMNAHD